MADQDGGEKLAWFLAGAALGAAGALLLAPQSGEETREQLRQRAERGRERLREVSDSALDRGRDAYGRGQELAEEAARSGRQVYDRGRELYEKGRELADDTAQRLRRPTATPEIDDAPTEHA